MSVAEPSRAEPSRRVLRSRGHFRQLRRRESGCGRRQGARTRRASGRRVMLRSILRRVISLGRGGRSRAARISSTRGRPWSAREGCLAAVQRPLRAGFDSPSADWPSMKQESGPDSSTSAPSTAPADSAVLAPMHLDHRGRHRLASTSLPAGAKVNVAVKLSAYRLRPPDRAPGFRLSPTSCSRPCPLCAVQPRLGVRRRSSNGSTSTL